MSAIKCMIVDDEPLAQQVLMQYITRTEGLQLTTACFTASEAFIALSKLKTNLLFLDIKMPSVTGIELIQSLRNPPDFVFTTAYSEYAVKSYELEAVDYLLKPIEYDRFLKAIEKYRQRTSPQFLREALQEPEHIFIKTEGSLHKIILTDLVFMQALRDYVKIVCTKRQYLAHMTLTALEQLLPVSSFARVHRSYIINRNRLTVIGRNEVLIDSYTIPVGDNYRGNLLAR
jgi:DNA-binding LytR/AlgR family response regulator